MAGYIFVQTEVSDAGKYDTYKQAVPAVIEKFGGRFIVRGGDMEALEGAYDGPRVVILEFPSVEQARAFWNSPEYAEVKALREGAANMTAVLIEGV
ncbi:MAG: DUF1330 domain-containing protein [Rhodospirillales bacterium]|jgi:uncharacterized protein (DUF1330 family)|nr:DUF1330 domain-containing protein [Rhodospirillales bacterium]MDP6773133.1 DUF1330 domain-containing protein [Rhodospirillales bacterium]